MIATLFLTGVLVACGGGEGGRDVTVANPRLVQTPNGDRVFTGTLVNNGSSTVSIAEIEVALYDDEGSRIETMRIQVTEVSPQDSAGFNQTIDSNQPIQQAQVQRILIP